MTQLSRRTSRRSVYVGCRGCNYSVRTEQYVWVHNFGNAVKQAGAGKVAGKAEYGRAFRRLRAWS